LWFSCAHQSFDISVVSVFLRPQRYTLEFVEKEPTFTLSFFDEKYRSSLSFCGSHSGRATDKAAETDLTPFATEGGSIAFEEARLVLECRKMYFQDLDPENFLVPEIEGNYPNKDYHRMFVGEVLVVLKRS
jgi:flavin reductase (DIM6/NTAB) family NADH-FMN oxidoreductase RutF